MPDIALGPKPVHPGWDASQEQLDAWQAATRQWDYDQTWHYDHTEYACDPAVMRDMSIERKDAIIFGDEPCPLCNGKQTLYDVQRYGRSDELRKNLWQCPCQVLIRWKANKFIKRILPTRYQRTNLWTMQPSISSKMSLERQAKTIEFVRNNPDASYFLFGEPGTGKTTFAAALVRRAIDRDWKLHFDSLGAPCGFENNYWIHYINWDTYIQSMLDWQNHPDIAEPPKLSPALIRKLGKDREVGDGRVISAKRCCVVIEEIDKSRMTEYKADRLFDLVCAIDETNGQMVITTNHTSKASFQRWLYGTDNDAINLTGEPVWRRISDNCKAVEFKKE